jgi:protein HOOK3
MLSQSLEEQNSSLVDANAALEEENRRVMTYKSLVDSYKTQVAELESKMSGKSKEIEEIKFELDQTRTRLKISIAERDKDTEALELYQERVRELEIMNTKLPKSPGSNANDPAVLTGGNMTEMTEAELLGDEEDRGLGGEMDDAITGTTTTDLKLQIRKLKRDLETSQASKADASRIIVLENLLEDASSMKKRYEQEYLASHRENLLLQNNLEEIRGGKSIRDG